ncbi:hypothetical protein [Vreelandella arcis]|uniref:Uncharacterized protein n=1 Tax=Vreelandella arcis TaxID=416873 RepID=A0A1H0CT60_9GAMM|nr:hypothetical protein [Halomonas arcis]SDN61059.1 hypothetical protein SAMN04487951_106187 [Halomonas arcis]
MPLAPSFNAPFQPAFCHFRTLLLVALGIIWLFVNSRTVPWSTLDFPLGLIALMAGTVWFLIPHSDTYLERDDLDDVCLKEVLYSVTIATVLTMAGLHLIT